jgi:YVTN family beta-propeller protein
MKRVLLLFTLVLVVFEGCKKNPETPSLDTGQAVVNHLGIYILNEGPYGQADGARLSYYNYDSNKVYDDRFEDANSGQHLGDTGDDMKIVGKRLYILMSGSKTIDILHLPDNRLLKSVGFPSPRSPHDMIIDTLRHRLYFTNLFAGSVTVTNDTTLDVIKDIQVGSNPQGIVLKGDKLFVCNSGYGGDSTVSVVNLNTLTVDTVLVLSYGPTNAALSADGKIVISCAGNATVKGSVYVIDPVSNSMLNKYQFSTNLFYNSGSMATDTSGDVYVIGVSEGSYYGGPIHKIHLSDGSITLNYLNAGIYYGIGVNPFTNDVVVSDVQNFSSDGIVSIYKSDGTLRTSFIAQKGPSVFAFRR